MEDRRKLINELNLYKIKNGTFRLTAANGYQFNSSIPTRHNQMFYLPRTGTNVEFFSPLLRMHRQHMTFFLGLDLNDTNFNAFKRYAIHEIKTTQATLRY